MNSSARSALEYSPVLRVRTSSRCCQVVCFGCLPRSCPRGEGGTDDDGDRQVDHIAAGEEVPQPLNTRISPRS
jgi:hypothetical protein